MPLSPISMAGHLRVNPSAQFVIGSGGEVYAVAGTNAFVLQDVSSDLLRKLLSLADGSRSLETICQEMADDDSAYLRELVKTLGASQLLEEVHSEQSPTRETFSESLGIPVAVLNKPIAILGNRALLDTFHRSFCDIGFSNCEKFFLQDFKSCTSPAFREFQRERVLSASECSSQPPLAQRGVWKAVDVPMLNEILQGFAFALCVLEGVPLQALFDVNQAALESGVPCLFVTASPEEAVVGPTVIRGGTACFRCRAIFREGVPPNFRDVLPFLSAPTSGPDMLMGSVIARACVQEVLSLLGRDQIPRHATSILKIHSSGEQTQFSILPDGKCPDCSISAGEYSSSLSYRAAASAIVELGRMWPISPMARTQPSTEAYGSVGILGGGTAGYLTALAFRRFHPEIKVTLIESSAVPIIGVGEATTPELVKFLHSPRFLGRDIIDLFARVRPTWKLGIKFRWGLPGAYDFTFPFQRGRLLESHLYESTINQQSLGAMLMMADRAPVFQCAGEEPWSLLHLVRWAYHLDNKRFVRYLQEEASAAGVHHLDARVVDATLSPAGDAIAGLTLEDGRQLDYDLYIDCSGFRSFLLEQKLGSKFLSYDKTLFTDRAIFGSVENGGRIKPYTRADTMNNGWCWNIPFEDADHLGYVFSSAFCDVEQATEEIVAKNPGIGDLALVKFRSGRHEHFWKGNVVALGNAHAFVEPLESTALHMLVLELELLMTHFPSSKHDQAAKSILNKKIGTRWDALRWFLGIHYKFNRRISSPFWQASNNDADISGAEERIALFRERAPLSYRVSLFYTVHPPEFFSDDHAYDTLLLGQRLAARFVEPVEELDAWRRTMGLLKRMTGKALQQHEVLPNLYSGGEGLAHLRDFMDREDSWLHSSLPA